MRIFGRPLRRYVANLLRAPLIARDAWRCARLFRQPAQMLRCYVTRSPMPGGMVELRSGLRIHLSPDPLDIVTIFAVFVRRDYGTVSRGSRVIDIGANIGTFALYAVDSGAETVHSYEPSTESYAYLRRNVDANGCGGRVRTFHAAIGAGPERMVSFPRRSSVLNALPPEGAATANCDIVPLQSLSTAVHRIGDVDLVKLDCEGAELGILATADADTLARIYDVRLEYHLGQGAAVAAALRERGFLVRRFWAADEQGGLAWFARRV